MATLTAPASPPTTIPTTLNAVTRIHAVDVLRGLVMVLMAIDHVRVYAGVPPGGPDAGVFFTRWVTHFCAPAFAFFAGTSAFLYGMKLERKSQLAQYLLTRGALLIILELTVIRFFWTFNLNLQDFMLAGVIWMLGWCMIGLSAFLWLPPMVNALIGILIIAGQNLFALVPRILPEDIAIPFGRFWEFVYPSGLDTFNGVSVLYSLVPWIGVMLTGYAFGAIAMMEPAKRKKLCMLIGASAIAVFLTGALVTADTRPDEFPFLFKILHQQKYPASVLFLAMTIGPMIFLFPFAEQWRGRVGKSLAVFGRVPFFYYLLHIILIHLTVLGVRALVDGEVAYEWFEYAPYATVPEAFRWSLPLLYVVFAVDVAILYFACRWYAEYKSGHPQQKWLRYL